MVLSVRMVEIVRSRLCRNPSSSPPRFGWERLRASISAVVELRMSASVSEQRKEMSSVRTTAVTKSAMARETSAAGAGEHKSF